MDQWRDYLTERLLRDEIDVKEYINGAYALYIETDDIIPFLVALRTIVELKGGIQEIVNSVSISKAQMYRILTNKSNTSFVHMLQIVRYCIS